MKKILSFALVLVMLLTLAGCGCKHTWEEADCVTPKTCTDCGETEGEALGHTWTDADCTTPRTCSVCGETDGDALGHTWTDATCTTARTCTVCAVTEGEPLAHEMEPKALRGTTVEGSCGICGEALTQETDDPASVALQILAGEWLAKEHFLVETDWQPMEEELWFSVSADGTVVSQLADNPGTGVVVFEGYNEWFDRLDYLVTINDVSYDVIVLNTEPAVMQWWYRNYYNIYNCEKP